MAFYYPQDTPEEMGPTAVLPRSQYLNTDPPPGVSERSLSGERRGLRAVMPFLGPAFIASVAYIDPGNFATNMAGGAQFGYMLLWVVLAANLMAIVKLGRGGEPLTWVLFRKR